MTLENFNYRTNPLFLRNAFDSNEPWSMPVIPKADINLTSDSELRLIGFDKVKNGKDNHYKRMVHFFLYDYEFESIWESPEKYVETLKQYEAVLTPDFSMYIEMNPVMQLYNTFRNRWVGAFLHENGIKVIPTVNWGLENTFDFCFNGIEKGSVVAVSTYMVSEHGNHSDQKEFFMKGYNEMLKRIEPELIICYHEPFPEMTGNILYINYELSSWLHYGDDEHKSMCNNEFTPIIKTAYGSVCSDTLKGSGSAFGGKWKPKKPQDERLLGKPGEIKESHINTSKGGYNAKTKIGDDGRAAVERYYTDHGYPTVHSSPHDHIFYWDPKTGNPDPQYDMVNYWNESIPELKSKGVIKMFDNMNYPDYNSFESISDFKWCVLHGSEIEFVWKDKDYWITYYENGNISIYQSYRPDTEKIYDTVDELLLYKLETGELLKDIILKAVISSRTL
ncbi:MAG: DUF4417 domain-containing protein [Clostridia bacterium]|nr:DUF4417 domain-containing protein [Clostridia bacterium]